MAAPSDPSDEDVFGSLNLFEEFSTKVKTSQPNVSDADKEWNDQKSDLEAKIAKLTQENLKLKSWLKVCINAKGCQVSDGRRDGPIAQVVFMNHDCVTKHRSEVESFFMNLCWSSANPMPGHGDTHIQQDNTTRPLPQCASMPLTESGDPETVQAFTATGNVQFHVFFCLDTMGRPLVDGNAQLTEGWEVPSYPVVFREALPVDEKPSAPQKSNRRKAACFNCGNEKHSLRDCPVQRDLVRISQNKRLFMDQMGASSPSATISGRRYHGDGGGEMAERFKNCKPGVISDALREALGINARQLPPYIYQMRKLGYPPGHMMDALVTKSDLKVYNIKDTDEEGEVPSDEDNDGGARQPKFNLSKLIDYPGFNIEPDSSIMDEWRMYNSVPMQASHHQDLVKQQLQPLAANEEEITPVGKRKNQDFHESSSSKKRRVEQAVDMDISMDELSGTPTRGWFQPPLPPTPDVATPPPLPPGSAPPTPVTDSPQHTSSLGGSTPMATSQDSSRSGSPDIDLLMAERKNLLAALEAGGEDSLMSDGDTVPSQANTTEEEEEEVEVEVEGESNGRRNGPGSQDMEQTSDGGEVNGRQGEEEKTNAGDTERKDSPDSPDPDAKASLSGSQTFTLDSTEGDSSVFMSVEEERPGKKDGEVEEKEKEKEEEVPNKSGVPHRRKFSVNITPHSFDEEEPQKKGIFKRLLGILKKEKN